MKKFNIKKSNHYNFDQRINLLSKNLMYAAVDPEYLSKISGILKRQLEAKKDTENYNFQLSSLFIDKSIVALRDSGQESILPGDSLRIQEEISNILADNEAEKFYMPILDKSGKTAFQYKDYPFSWKVSQELRAHFLLKTESSDSFDILMDQIDGLIFKYLDPIIWTDLKRIMKKSEDRMAKSTYTLLSPDQFVGEQIQLTPKEMADNKIISASKEVFADKRKVSHDLLCMKEFVSILKGETAHPLSIAMGFFAKYMPEFSKEGIFSIIFKVTDNKLSGIEVLRKKENRKMYDFEDKRIYFSPVEAAYSLTRHYFDKNKIFDKDEDKEFDLFDNESSKYFVLVDGAVAGPSKPILAYEKLVLNDTIIPAGEVFLFEKMQKDVIATRIYFTPYKYENIHLMHQHNSVIFGTNDQSYHSCVSSRGLYTESFLRSLFLKSLNEDSSQKNLYNASMVAVLVHFVDPNNENKKSLIDILDSKYNNMLMNSFSSLYETSSFGMENIIENEVPERMTTLAGCKDFMKILLQNYAPLSKRWFLYQYLEDSKGITKEEQLTMYNQLIEDIKLNKIISFLNKKIEK